MLHDHTRLCSSGLQRECIHHFCFTFLQPESQSGWTIADIPICQSRLPLDDNCIFYVPRDQFMHRCILRMGRRLWRLAKLDLGLFDYLYLAWLRLCAVMSWMPSWINGEPNLLKFLSFLKISHVIIVVLIYLLFFFWMNCIRFADRDKLCILQADVVAAARSQKNDDLLRTFCYFQICLSQFSDIYIIHLPSFFAFFCSGVEALKQRMTHSDVQDFQIPRAILERALVRPHVMPHFSFSCIYWALICQLNLSQC